MHSGQLIKEIKTYKIDEKSVVELATYLNSIKMKDVEKLYNRLFNDVMKNGSKYFELSRRAATLLSIKFVEVVITSKNSEDTLREIVTKNLDEREIAGMQYLAGYVLRKVYMKLKCCPKNKSEESQQAMSLILAGKLTEKNIHPSFIDELSRGGLWEVPAEMEKVFTITERYFSILTAPKTLRTIKIDKFVESLAKFPPLLLTFNNISEKSEITVEKKVKMNTLFAILTLYLRVRAFSLTKDIVAKTRHKSKTKKSLRKSIKMASRNEDTKTLEDF